MEDQSKNNSFQYAYSAKEQKEVLHIRRKYAAPEADCEDKLERLRHLDRSVTQKASVVALSLGIVGTLLLGVGMCCCMVWGGVWFIPGIIVGLLGIGTAILSYPLYSRIVEKERVRIAPEILRLADELLK